MAANTQQKEGILDLSILKDALPESWSGNVRKLVDSMHRFDGKKYITLYYLLLKVL